MILIAHIAGIPVEETALSLAPAMMFGCGLAGRRLKERVAKRRSFRRRPRSGLKPQ